jgi:WhiB family redox-sensing transcriptional regulator
MVASQHQEEWQVRAACRGPQAVVFFPPSYVERKEERLSREREAKAICHLCSVREECLEYAIRIKEPHGIWGGLNESERKHLLDRRCGDGRNGRARLTPHSH